MCPVCNHPADDHDDFIGCWHFMCLCERLREDIPQAEEENQ